MELSDWRKYVEEETKKIKKSDKPGATPDKKPSSPVHGTVKSTIVTGPSKIKKEVAAKIEPAPSPFHIEEKASVPITKPEQEPKPEKITDHEIIKPLDDDVPVVRVGKKTTSTVHEVWAKAEKGGKQEEEQEEDCLDVDASSAGSNQTTDELIANRHEQEQLFITDFGAPKKTRKTASPRNEEGLNREDKESARQELLNRLLDPTLTLEETALILNMCKATVRRYTNKGLLPHFRTPGNQRRFRLSDVLEFMKKYQKK